MGVSSQSGEAPSWHPGVTERKLEVGGLLSLLLSVTPFVTDRVTVVTLRDSPCVIAELV